MTPIPLQPPREQDGWFMQAIEDTGAFNEEEQRCINRFRCHQQVLFLSDIMDAGGQSIDEKYLHRRPINEQWSKLVFSTKNPPRNHLSLWRNALHTLKRKLGKFITPPFKIWEYQYHEEEHLIYHYKGSLMDVYSKALEPQYINRPNCFSISAIGIPSVERGDICSVKKVSPNIIGVRSLSQPAPPKSDPTSFWDVVKGWGQTWLWDDFSITGELEWLSEAIIDNTLVAVTDGSYIRERHPHLNSAAFVFECSKGRGRLFGSFIEITPEACAYRGELLGLMVIHLILLQINDFHKGIQGSVHIYSDCLGALERVEQLLPYRIPSRCSHGEIEKNPC